MTANAIPTRPLGTTGERVSIIGLGGSHISGDKVSRKLAIDLVRRAIDEGITFLDNCWDYGDGESERRMGDALRDGYRERAFLMTKIDGRTAKSAMKQLEECLKRLKTDSIDLVQHHEMIRFEDADRIVAAEGAAEALERAREQGKCRYIGFTGHKDPLIHLYTLDRARDAGFRFDAVQLPVNAMDFHFRSFERHFLPRLVKEGIAPLGMKSLAYGVLLKSDTLTAEECLRYALSLPISVLITGIDSIEVLDQALRVARSFEPFTEQEMNSLRDRTKALAQTGRYELFKTSDRFDATAKNPDWLGEEDPELARLMGD
jgi:aryl-alcohol dehydrogenase-like predicted oxidoreductase